MKIIEVLKQPIYLFISLFISFAFFFIYVYLQIQGIIENFIFWFTIIPFINLIVFTIFTLIMGASFSYQIYLLRQPKLCYVDGKKKNIKPSSGVNFSVVFLSFFISACPTCASIGLLLLPISVFTFIANYGIYINLFSIVLLLFIIYYLGGFKK